MNPSAKVVVVGAGIVGTSTAYHLARLGWTDVAVVDQGPLFRTGGSTGHAPGLVFQTNPSRTMSRLAAYTVRAYGEAVADGQPCFHSVGGIEVAGSPERWEDLKRKHGLATSWGIDSRLLSPDEVTARCPLVDASRIHGGFFVPTDGVARPVDAMDAMAAEAQERGVTFSGDTEVVGFDVRDGRVRAVDTSRGRLDADIVLVCAGIWGPKVGRLAGVSIPVQPMAHQYALTAPLAELAGAREEITQPILRHQDAAMYFRQVGDCLGIGSYNHRSMPVASEQVLSLEAARTARGPRDRWAGMPSVTPFTEADFKQPWQDACDLLPALRATGVAEGMNGLFLFTADGMPVLGESREVRGLWVAEAVWITHAGGVGKVMAEWLALGEPSIDLRECDLARFDEYAHSPAYVRARSSQSFQEVYDIIHPLQPMEEPRPLRVSPFHQRERELGAFFLEGGGWERPHWYESNDALLADREVPGRAGWAGRYWSPIVGAEAQVTRERVALYDMTPLRKAEVVGPGAVAFLQRLVAGRADRSVGSVTYTLLLDHRGGIRSDVTVTRLGPDRFQIGCNGPIDLAWMRRHLPPDGSVTVRDITSATCCLGVWGPRARDLVARLADDDVSSDGFRFFRARRLHLGEVPVLAMRLSYVGELGWELYTTADHGLRLWDLLWEAGADLGVIAGGRGAFNSLRLEKGYRAWGTDMWSEHTPTEAGLEFAVRSDGGDFVGREALERSDPPSRRLACLTLDDPVPVVMGGEPVYASGRPVGFVTSAAHGYTTGTSIAYAWVPADLATPGQPLAVEYFARRLPATVSVEPLFDPRMERMRR